MTEQLQIRTLGEFSMSRGENRISSGDSRSRKIWMLLAYLLSRRGRPVSQNELIGQIWGGDSASDNPENTLKVTLHRARGLLDKLWPGAGHDLILRKGDGYLWNPEIPMELDAEEFERLCAGTREERIRALTLYRGDFLGKLSTGTWVIPIATHYHNLYIQTLLKLLPGLAEEGEHDRVIALCREALLQEPYDEELRRHLMRSLIAREDRQAAALVYEELRERLYIDFGITPAEETRALWREATNTVADRSMPIETVLEHLLEQDPSAGALLCDFDCFKVICHAEARAMIRSGKATHVALLSVSSHRGKPLTRRSLDRAMDNLGEQIRLNLRRGDVFSRCSTSQYVIMLPQANFENSCVVCRRLIAAMDRRYPHSPIRIHYMVRPLSTQTLENR